MFSSFMSALVLIFETIPILILTDHAESKNCTFPLEMRGKYFYADYEYGNSFDIMVDEKKWGDFECKERYDHPKPDLVTNEANFTNVVSKRWDDCLYCLDVVLRTPNVLQFKKSDCFKHTGTSVVTSCEGVTNGMPEFEMLTTMFRRMYLVNCASTFVGKLQFSYEFAYGTGGACDNANNRIKACYDPASIYWDNYYMIMRYSKCSDIPASINKTITYQCLGTWFATVDGYVRKYAAIADIHDKDIRTKYRCLSTHDHHDRPNKVRWVMSSYASCRSLFDVYTGDIRLVLTYSTSVLNDATPKCSLPRSVKGTWGAIWIDNYFQRPFSVNVTDTNFTSDQPWYMDGYDHLTCQHTQGTKYLMREVHNLLCYVEYKCIDIVERYGNIVELRIGKTFKYTKNFPSEKDKEVYPQSQLLKIFQEVCSTSAFIAQERERRSNFVLTRKGSPLITSNNFLD